MPVIDLNISRKVFNNVYIPYLEEEGTRVQIFFGGASSGKSVFLAQRLVLDLISGRRNYLVVRNVSATLRRSVFNEIIKVIQQFQLTPYFKINLSDLEITCLANNMQALFTGLDNVEKIKSITPKKGVITDVWIEEATEMERPAFLQLGKRLRGRVGGVKKRITLSFNPILQSHWIYKDYFGGWDDTKSVYRDDRVAILKTTYKDNRFLAGDDIMALENEEDKYFYEVYTLGNWGVLSQVVFTNWRCEDLSGMRAQFINRKSGLDFGFASSPAAAVLTHYDQNHKTIYVFDELYQRGLTNDQLARELRQKIGFDSVICDSAEPKSIAELRQYDILAKPARKGKDSVNHGIQWLQQQKIVVDPQCQNFKNEIQQYRWKTDRDDNVIPTPVDRDNHLMDALRYAYEEEYRARLGVVSVTL